MTPDVRPCGWDASPWIGGWRLVVLFLATIMVATAASIVFELWLQQPFYAHLGWAYRDGLADKLFDVLETIIVTGIAIIGPGILLFRSVARLGRANCSLTTALHSAQSASIAKSQFLANMSHELRTPLNAVIGFSGFMETEPHGPLQPKYKSYAMDIRKAGLHLLDVINDVLDISKAEATELSVAMTDINLGDVFAEVQMLATRLAQDAAITLHFEIFPASSQVMMRADHTRLKQALLNLVSNGIKFNSPGGTVTACAFVGTDRVRIEVQDSGIGMKPDEIAIAFQPFVQLHTGHSRKYEGTGLGLPLTKALIEAMRGSIVFQSEAGVGSCVTINLPRGVLAGLAEAA